MELFRDLSFLADMIYLGIIGGTPVHVIDHGGAPCLVCFPWLRSNQIESSASRLLFNMLYNLQEVLFHVIPGLTCFLENCGY